MTLGLVAGATISGYQALLPLWFVLGLGYSVAQTPSGRLLRRSSHPEDRPALFAAQFTLSHACWLVTYPMAGWLGASVGLAATFLILASIAAVALVAAALMWPVCDPEVVEHRHSAHSEDDPHWAEGSRRGGRRHAHALVIDDLHPQWPREP